MKKETKKTTHFAVDNLIKIMNDRKLTKIAFAELVGFPEAKWNKISNGKQSLSVEDLSNIAEKLRIREIDIFTYPKVCIEADRVDSDVKAQLTVELKKELKSKVLELIFGNSNLEILNK
jgi:transcriptional regulator with XRE-family HTH domain